MKKLNPIFGIHLVFALSALLFTSCEPDEEEPQKVNAADGRSALIGNEGSFTNENASLTLVNLTKSTAEQDVYSRNNDDLALGDVLQSMNRRGDEIFLVVNNSAKIEVIDATTFERKRTITISGSSPRYILFVSDEKAYVSDLFTSGLHIVNPTTGTYEGLLETQVVVEEMMFYEGEVFATAPFADTLLIIDPMTDSVTGGLALSAGADDIEVDADGMLRVMANGTFDGSAPPAFDVVDPETREIVRTYEFPAGTGSGGVLEMSADGQTMVYLSEGDVYRMDISAELVPVTPWIESGDRNFYGLAVNRETDEIAVMDAADFNQAGRVYFYNAGGEPTKDFATGIIPRTALWLED